MIISRIYKVIKSLGQTILKPILELLVLLFENVIANNNTYY